MRALPLLTEIIMSKPSIAELLSASGHTAYTPELVQRAIHALYGWAVEHLDLRAFVYPVAKANTPSRRIPESLGGLVVAEREAPAAGGRILDEVVYRIPAERVSGGAG